MKKIFFLWTFVIIQLNEVIIIKYFTYSSPWLTFHFIFQQYQPASGPTVMIFLVKFWKVTVLQVNWLVSQECSWELSNLLYLYPSKISNLRRCFFSIRLCPAEREELKLNVSKHFLNLAEAALAMCKMYSIFSWWNLTSSPSLFLGGFGWSRANYN